MGFHRILILIQLILLIVYTIQQELGLPGCPTKCGDIDIPYPFGLKEGCYLETKFYIKCNDSKPILEPNFIVKNINIIGHEVSIMSFLARDCYNESGQRIIKNNWAWFTTSITVPLFSISNTKNKFTVFGCDSYAFLNGNRNGNVNGNQESYSTGCISTCQSFHGVPNDGSCSGIGCCQIDIPQGLKNISVFARSFNNHTNVMGFNNCTNALVVEKDKFNFSRDYLRGFSDHWIPMVLEWAIDNGKCLNGQSNQNCNCGKNSWLEDHKDGSAYFCNCLKGYIGNPYLAKGCQDVDECKIQDKCKKDEKCINTEGGYKCKRKDIVLKVIIGVAIGFVALVVSSSWLYLVSQKRKMIKLKEKFFKKNGGLILQQKLSQNGVTNETAKIFTEEDLKKATNNFDESSIIGRGGYGTVYKGVLSDNKIVAIKKSKIVDQSQIEQFINEVTVLSQINHRNVVKLLGCCLETEVPLLVYEFVPNGTLFEHVHNRENASYLLWEIRLAIAAETAGALSYLHSAASIPIIHRDVKSSNILLDKYTAKVSDFGASRLVPLDQTELATMVQGTLGYLDPEYLHTNQLTDKSDVYSFGVVLVELMTGKKALSFDRPEEERNLAMYFLSSFRKGRLFEVVDSHIVSEENKEQIQEVAEIAKRCLNMRGEDRPGMKEVTMELEGLKTTEKHPWVNVELNLEETQYLLGHKLGDGQNVDGNTTNTELMSSLGNTSGAYQYGDSISSTAYNSIITMDFSGR